MSRRYSLPAIGTQVRRGLKIIDKTNEQLPELFSLFVVPISKRTSELRVANTFKSLRSLPAGRCSHDQNDAAVLRARMPLDQALSLEHPNLTTHSPSVHASGACEIADRDGFAITERTQHVHSLFGEFNPSSARHPHMDSPARQEPTQTRESESDRDELVLESWGLAGHMRSESYARWNAGL